MRFSDLRRHVPKRERSRSKGDRHERESASMHGDSEVVKGSGSDFHKPGDVRLGRKWLQENKYRAKLTSALAKALLDIVRKANARDAIPALALEAPSLQGMPQKWVVIPEAEFASLRERAGDTDAEG